MKYQECIFCERIFLLYWDSSSSWIKSKQVKVPRVMNEMLHVHVWMKNLKQGRNWNRSYLGFYILLVYTLDRHLISSSSFVHLLLSLFRFFFIKIISGEDSRKRGLYLRCFRYHIFQNMSSVVNRFYCGSHNNFPLINPRDSLTQNYCLW